MFWCTLLLCIGLNTHLMGAPQHGCSTFGTLKYPATFTHFEYVNPHAPQGGTLHMAWPGTFNSLNPFIVRGDAETFSSFCIASLMSSACDEAGSSYVYGAQSIDIAPDLSSVTFTLRPDLRFDNGEPITAADVIFAFHALREKGRPLYRLYFKAITDVVALDERTVRFTCSGNKNREIGLILGQIPLISRTFFANRNFEEPLSTPMPCSGPYTVKEVRPGANIVYTRQPQWWGHNVPSQKGLYNPAEIQVLYFRDQNAMFETFKAGGVDYRIENVARQWATGYGLPAVDEGRILKRTFAHQQAAALQGFFFNTRRPLFADRRVRKALSLLYDFEWANKNLFYGQYKRSVSYFSNSPLAAEGAPTAAEKTLLESLTESLPPEALTQAFTLPADFQGSAARTYRQQALALLADAGWVLKNGQLVNAQTGAPFQFEILIENQSYERVVLNLKKCLEVLPIHIHVRLLDTATYQQRIDHHDYDMIMGIIPQAATPGNEQRNYWGSASAQATGSMNYAGIESPAVDNLIEKLIDAQTFDELRLHGHVLDRALLWGYYMIHGWYGGTLNVAHWRHVHFPETVASQQPLVWIINALWLEPSASEGAPPAHPLPSLWERFIRTLKTLFHFAI